MTVPRRALAVVVVLAASTVAGGCQGGRGSRGPGARTATPPDAPPPEEDRPFDAGSKATRDRVEAAVARLGDVDGSAFADLVRVLVGAGDPAIPPLLRTLTDGPPRARARAAYVLGFLQDRRTLAALARAAADDPDATVRSDAGASLLEMGDARGFAPLVEALDDADARRRVRAIDALAAATGGTRLGYEPDGPADERAAAVARWRAFLERRRAEADDGDTVPTDVPAPDEIPAVDAPPPADAPNPADAPTPADDARPGGPPPRDGRDRRAQHD